MGGINWLEVFPTRKSIGIFFGYVSLFVAQGIFVTASQSQDKDNKYNYDIVLVVLLTESLKLVVSCCLYCRENTFSSLITSVIKGKNVLILYFVPAFLYCLYNNLSFHNLAAFDPTTYFILLQLRVVITGVLFQIVFKKYLTRKQWMSLVLLTAGCMIKQINFGDQPEMKSNDISGNSNESSIDYEANRNNKNTFGFDLSINTVFILIQTVCSCMAGVYNEYLLKDKGEDINIYVQNVYMYLDSILCNALILLVQGNILSVFSFDKLNEIIRPSVLIVIITNCLIGITTSFFLKHMNSIIKTFASAPELVLTSILCRILFNIPIFLNTIASITIVSTAVFIYSQSPVVNLGRNSSIKEKSKSFEDRIALLNNDEDEEDLLQMDSVIVRQS